MPTALRHPTTNNPKTPPVSNRKRCGAIGPTAGVGVGLFIAISMIRYNYLVSVYQEYSSGVRYQTLYFKYDVLLLFLHNSYGTPEFPDWKSSGSRLNGKPNVGPYGTVRTI